MTGSYDYRLVTLSVVMAVCAAYAALDLAGRTTASRGRIRLVWLAGGAAAMGLGIWSMHYIGMLAFLLPIPVFYDWPTVLVSLFAANFASGVALFVVSRSTMDWGHALAGSAIMGSGIATMHYIGMAAMRLPAMCRYDSLLVVLSVVLAIVMSLVALWLSFHLREHAKTTWPKKCASAVVMGAGIAAMHPGLIAYAAVVMTEPLAALLILGSALLALHFRGRWQAVVYAGALLGLACLVRPASLLAGPLLLLTQPRPLWQAAARAAAATAVALLVILPWTIRNCERLDGCAFVSTNGGWNLAIGAITDSGRFQTLRATDGCPVVTGQVQQDRCWAEVGRTKIAANFGHWLSLAPLKLS